MSLRTSLYCIEGIPVIIRFKTILRRRKSFIYKGIEGIPVIIRFKTSMLVSLLYTISLISIEGIPLITRFLNFYWNESFLGSFLIVNYLLENSVRFFSRVCYNENWKKVLFYIRFLTKFIN